MLSLCVTQFFDVLFLLHSLVIFYCCFFFYVVFFFQAEDGIRDLVRSRGLGDVYKRQGLVFSTNFRLGFDPVDFQAVLPKNLIHRMAPGEPVSYTHLTLPTSDLV